MSEQRYSSNEVSRRSPAPREKKKAAKKTEAREGEKREEREEKSDAGNCICIVLYIDAAEAASPHLRVQAWFSCCP